jgi:hypothetical protein
MQDQLKFLQLVSLPAYQGLALAATAVRALELFSDLVDGQKPPAPLAEADRFDIMDECLDLVVPNSDLPSGFEFTGLTVAGMWAALKAAQVPEHELELWRSALAGSDMESLRAAARLRVRAQPDGVFLHSRSLFMPDCMADPDWNTFDPKLDRLMHTANAEWKTPRRSRSVVEVLEEVTQPGRDLPVSGQHYPAASDISVVPCLRHAQQRLQPQCNDATYHEFQLALPSLESSYFSPNFSTRNVFAWLRVTRHEDAHRGVVLVLDEVGSDWVTGDIPSVACPVADQWLEIAIRALLDIAEEMQCNTVAWISGEIQHRLNPGLPLSVAQLRYDKDISDLMGQLRGPLAQDDPFEYPTYRYQAATANVPTTQPTPVTEILAAVLLCTPPAAFEEIVNSQDDDEPSDGPGHGNHWETLYTLEKLTSEVINRDLQDSKLISEHPCVDVVNDTDRTEAVFCLRWGDDRIAHDLLVVSNAQSESRQFFSAYPVALDGIRYTLELDHFAPWPYGIEAWAYGNVTQGGLPLCFFDTQYYAGSATYQTGQMLEVSLAAWAYTLQPISLRKFEIKEGPLWEMARQRRLDDGESEEEAAQAVDIHMTGASIFLPRFGKVAPDEAEYQGVISAVDTIAHDGQLVYRLEMVVARPDDDAFKLAVYASEHVLDGYVPRLGEDVQGVLWLQGQIIGLQQSALGNQD